MTVNSLLRSWTGSALLGLAALMSACGGGGGSSSVFTPPLPATGTVQGGVLDASTGVPIAGATVQAGSLSATSATDGKFTLAAIDAPARVALKVKAANYAESTVIAYVTPNTTTTVSTPLLRLGNTAPVDLTTGGTVTVPASPGQVVVPANGPSCTGSAIVSITPINGSLNPGFLPGDFTVGGSTLPLESFGAVTLSINYANGTPVPLSACAAVTIRIPVSTRSSTLPTVLPLYYLDPATGQWVREGNATLSGTAPNQYYEATVSRAGTWGVDQPYETINATGCVIDQAGARVTAARVVADGIDYTGSTSVATDSAGNFALPMKKSARAAITARSGGKTSNSVAVGPSATNLAAGSGCLVLTDQANNVTIKLTFGERPTDVDSHLLTPSGDHIYFSNKGDLSAAPFANLDVDDVDSFGPEIVTVRRLQVGTYTYVVNNFSATFGPGLTESPTRVELNIGGDTTAYAPPAGEGTSLWWTVFTFTVNAQCGITVATVNTWSAGQPPTPLPSGATTYCTAP